MQQSNHKYTNQLIIETSPYLLSHAHNPVDWNAWGEPVLEKAIEENKLLIISVGYAACHWCHVMERESFEDEGVAEIMNDSFISIKVDREERPDVDQIYMNAVMLLSNRGGWPLNAIALPDGRPIFAGTYFPKDRWILLLKQISKLWKNNPEKLIEQAEGITQGIRRSEIVSLIDDDSEYQRSDIKQIAAGILDNMDFKLGGQSGAPKFPMPVGLEFLMHYSFFEKNDRALEAVKITLDQMAMGGIYDQIGGGFARYSVDEFWLVPHFEKMLYDNAQLVSLYSKAYQLTKNDLYKNVVYETIDFIERELTSPEGAFYSALDADSEGEEGKYYIWHQNELEDLLEDDFEFISGYFNITQSGNWETGKNILHRKLSPEQYIEKNKLDPKTFESKLNHSKSLMLEYRENRVRPALDDKILTAWNSLMINGLVDAYRVFGEEKFLTNATNCAEFILENCYDDSGLLYRNYKNGRSNINGFLDDYAFLIDALINLYQATFNERWLNLANNLVEYTIKHFFDESSGMFFFTSELDPALIARKMEIADNVIPSSNSAIAWNLFRLGKYFDNGIFVKKAEQMLKNIKNDLTRGGIYYSNWSNLMLKFIHDPYEVAITGPNAENYRSEMEKYYLPNILLVGSNEESNLPLLKGKYSDRATMVYICENKTCRKPTESVKEALDNLK